MITEIQKFREKYPDYGDIDDVALAGKLAQKYPEAYRDLPEKVAAEIKTDKPSYASSGFVAGMEGAPLGIEETGWEKNVGDFFTLPPVVDKNAEVPQWQRDNPNLAGLYGVGRGIVSRAVKPTLETLGAVGGSLASPIVGTALGYGIGKKTGDIIEGQYAQIENPALEMKSVSEELKGSAVDVGSALALGKGMELAGRGASATADYLFEDLPKKLYSSAVKLPLSKKWTEVLPGKELSKRTAAVEEGIRSKVPPSEYGLEKAKMLEQDVRGYVDDIIQIGAKDPNKTFKTEEVLKSGLSKAYSRAENSSDPAGAKATIDSIAERFRQHGDTITIDKANAIKRQLYDEVKWGGAETTALGGQITETSKKGIAHDLMVRMEEIYPELKSLNATDASRINLIEALEKSVARESNKDVIGLGAKVLVGPKSWPLAIWEATIGHPQIKARLAFALSKARPERWGKTGYPDLPPEYQPPPIGKPDPFQPSGPLRTPQDRQAFINSLDDLSARNQSKISEVWPQEEAAFEASLGGENRAAINVLKGMDPSLRMPLVRSGQESGKPVTSPLPSSMEDVLTRRADLNQTNIRDFWQSEEMRQAAAEQALQGRGSPLIVREPGTYGGTTPPETSGTIRIAPREEPAAMKALRGRPRTTPPQDEALKRLVGTRKMQEFYKSKGLSPYGKPIE